MISAIYYLHTNHICHRATTWNAWALVSAPFLWPVFACRHWKTKDLKPENFLFHTKELYLGPFPNWFMGMFMARFQIQGAGAALNLEMDQCFLMFTAYRAPELGNLCNLGHPAKRRALRKISWSWSTLAWQLPISCSVATFEGSREGHPDTLKGVYNNLKWISKIYDISYHINRGT